MNSNYLEIKQFPLLYGIDKKNKIKEWNIKVYKFEGYSELVYEYGYIGGKKTVYKQKIEIGKNIGKKNETSHFEQAILDAQSKWNKKKSVDNYRETKIDDQEKQVETESDQNKPKKDSIKTNKEIFPMLANDYKKNKSKITFPCQIQPKLDGYRMIYNPETKRVTSRNGKDFQILYNSELYEELKNIDMHLDGELYIHDKNFVFENYGILRKIKVTEADKLILNKIEYHVYDTPNEKLNYSKRKELISKLETLNLKKIKIVKTLQCDNEEDIKKYHNEFVKDGYEGSMIRNAKGMYKCKYRSYDLLKYKDFDDSEFKIVGFTSEKDTNGENSLIVWTCETNDNKTFNVRPKGNEDERRELYINGESYIGQNLWVQYFGLTDNGIPRFPTTARESCSEYLRNIVI